MKRFLFLPLLALVAAGCKPPAQPVSQEVVPVPITTASVKSQSLYRTIKASGTLAGYDENMLTPKVEGRLKAVYVDSGDIVLPGQPLLETDPTDYLLAVNDARRALEAELAAIDLTELPVGEFDVEAVPLVRRAEASRQNAIKQYDRVKNNTGASPAERDTAETDLKVAEASKRDAVTNARARLASARWRKATLDIAEQRLRDCVLRAPEPSEWFAFASVMGVPLAPPRYTIGQRYSSVGDMIRTMPVTNVFKLVVTQWLKLRAILPERYVVDVRVGQEVEITTDAEAQPVLGRVSRIHPIVDPSTRTFQVEILIPNGAGKLRPGSFANATLKTRVDDNVLTVPPQAVVTFAGTTKIFVIDGDEARAVPVEIGQRETDWVEVKGKLAAGAKVATSGLSQLVDGSKVRIR